MNKIIEVIKKVTKWYLLFDAILWMIVGWSYWVEYCANNIVTWGSLLDDLGDFCIDSFKRIKNNFFK